MGPTLELPFLHQNQGRIAEAEAFRENQAARVRLLQTAILAEIETALALYNNARETAAAATQGLVAAQNQERLARASYQAGEWSQLEVSNASSFLALSMITSRQAVASVHQALASLELAIQHPVLFPASPQEFN